MLSRGLQRTRQRNLQAVPFSRQQGWEGITPSGHLVACGGGEEERASCRPPQETSPFAWADTPDFALSEMTTQEAFGKRRARAVGRDARGIGGLKVARASSALETLLSHGVPLQRACCSQKGEATQRGASAEAARPVSRAYLAFAIGWEHVAGLARFSGHWVPWVAVPFCSSSGADARQRARSSVQYPAPVLYAAASSVCQEHGRSTSVWASQGLAAWPGWATWQHPHHPSWRVMHAEAAVSMESGHIPA